MRQTLGFGRKRHVVSEDSGQIGIVVARREEPLALELQLDRLEDGVRPCAPAPYTPRMTTPTSQPSSIGTEAAT